MWFSRPLMDINLINSRLDDISYFIECHDIMKILFKILKQV